MTKTPDLGSMTVEDALAHFGVKGMKWGVRRSRGEGSPHQARISAIAANSSKGGTKQAAVRVGHVLATSKRNKRLDRVAASKQRSASLHENRIKQLERVGAGVASRFDKVKVSTLEVSPSARKRHDGLAGAAANKAANMRARDARIARGEASIKDLLARVGGDRIIDTGRSDKARVSSR